MGRWTRQEATVCIFGTVNCAEAEYASDARRIVDTHNADCDAYEARIAELEAKVKSQRSRISQLTHGMADERKANNKLLANIEQLKEWNAEALEENNRLDAEADAARQYAHTMDLQNADYGRVVDELARVKAESLRVVPTEKHDMGYWEVAMAIWIGGATKIYERYDSDEGQLVRLERWADDHE